MDPRTTAAHPASYMAFMQAQADASNAQNASSKASSSQPPAQPGQQQAAPPAEDAVHDGGDAIDTFSSYIPTALPRCILNALRDRANGVQTTASQDVQCSTTADNEHEIIELLDSEDELEIVSPSKTDVTNTDQATLGISDEPTNIEQSNESNVDMQELFTQIQSHTSPAVESALLSSVSAPSVSDASAEVVLPLVKEGKLSPLQAEGACLAVERFQRMFLGEGKRERAGEFLQLCSWCRLIGRKDLCSVIKCHTWLICSCSDLEQ